MGALSNMVETADARREILESDGMYVYVHVRACNRHGDALFYGIRVH